jgi:predicted glycosyltransferase
LRLPGDEPRIVIFTHDGRGLGHLRRLCRVAARLQEKCSVLVITGHRAASWMVPEECEFVHLPSLDSIEFNKSRQWGRKPFLRDGRNSGRLLRKAVLRAVFDSYCPDAVILDYLPMGQDAEMLEILRSGGAFCYFILRGVLGNPEQVRRLILNENGRFLLEQCYRRIFVAADPKIVDVCEEYDFGETIARKVIYTGYVVDIFPLEARLEIRKDRRIPDGTPWVVCSAGGGKDGEDLIEQTYELIDLYPSVYFDLVLGPRSRLKWSGSRWLDLPRVRIMKEDTSLPLIHAACDVLISRGGYNSLLEGLGGNARVLVVPTPGDYEQLAHASRLSQQCPVDVVRDASGLAVQLEHTLEVAMETRPPFELGSVLSIGGAAAIASAIEEDLSSQKRALA